MNDRNLEHPDITYYNDNGELPDYNHDDCGWWDEDSTYERRRDEKLLEEDKNGAI